jgi:polyphosphate glucokinase
VTQRVLVIDAGATTIKSALSEKGELASSVHRRPTPFPCSPDVFLQVLDATLKRHDQVDALAVGFPGDVSAGIILDAANLSRVAGAGSPVSDELVAAWHRFDLQGEVTTRSGLPARVINDAEMALRGCCLGSGRELMVTLGTGCGVALVEEGKVQVIDDVGGASFDGIRSFDDALGERGRRIDEAQWTMDVVESLNRLVGEFRADRLHLAGGNSRRLSHLLLRQVNTPCTIERGEPVFHGGFSLFVEF